MKKEELANNQKIINELYAKEGKLTDEILDLQLAVNDERYKNDIPDETEFVYQNFVQ